MPNGVLLDKVRRSILPVGLGWIALWFLPWGRLPTIASPPLLAAATDMFRVALALALFTLPGILLFSLIRSDDVDLCEVVGVVPIGFTLASLLIGLIGIAGRLVGAPFMLVKTAFVTLGLVELVLWHALRSRGFRVRQALSNLAGSLGSSRPLWFALLLSVLTLFVSPLFFIDDTTYLAYLQNWQHSVALGFQNLVLNLDVTESPRYWLAMYPMGQALLSDVSGLAGILLLGSYLEFLLVPMAVVTAYWLGRELGLSRRAAGLAALIQVSLYTWMIGEPWPAGMWFYQNMSEDKVTAVFLMAPVYIAFILHYLRQPTRRSLVLVFLAAMAMAFTHPVSHFFAFVIGFGMAVCASMVARSRWQNTLAVAAASAASLVPAALVRYSTSAAQVGIPFDGASASASFQITRYSRIISEVFYGLNPDVLRLVDLQLAGAAHDAFQVFRWLPALILALAGIYSIFRIRQGAAYWYLLSCVALVAWATVPYTGWLLGYFVSARLISRASWFAPLGLAVVLLGRLLHAWISGVANTKTAAVTAARGRLMELGGIVACLVFVSPILAYAAVPRIPAYFENLDHDRQLAAIGDYIDRITSEPATAIALDYEDTQLLPGVSAHARLISFREEVERNEFTYTLPPADVKARLRASNIIRAAGQGDSGSELCDSAVKYDLKFVVAKRAVAPAFKRALEVCGLEGDLVYSTRDLVLLELR